MNRKSCLSSGGWTARLDPSADGGRGGGIAVWQSASYEHYLRALSEIKSERAMPLMRGYQLRCEVEDGTNAAVLRMQKSSWTQGDRDEGVFFEIRAGEREVKNGRFSFTVQAVGLRLWKGYVIKPGEFAAEFRARINAGEWPNASVDYGPHVLMQGCVLLDPRTFRAEVLKLIGRFIEMHGMIDEMIAKREIHRRSSVA